MARRDVPFWQRLAPAAEGPVLELGCGTGRVTLPMARAGVEGRRHRSLGADAARARDRVRRARARRRARALVRGDIRALPFRADAVRAGRGALRHPAVAAARARSRRHAAPPCATCSRPAAGSVIELVADLPTWHEYRERDPACVAGGPAGKAHLTLVESVRQDRRKGLTIFDQEFVERRGGATVAQPVLARLQHAVGAPDDAAPREGRASTVDGPYWAATTATRGSPEADDVDSGRRTGGDAPKRSVYGPRFRRFFWSFSHVRPFQVAHHQAQEGRPRRQARKIFTRIIKELTVAARNGGGDPDMNPRLRTIIADAKAVNMPADNIKQAIQRGTGELPGVNYEEVTYEGYGPGGAAVIIEVLTDNKNRTVGELRHMLDEAQRQPRREQSVAWMFSKKGYIVVDKAAPTRRSCSTPCSKPAATIFATMATRGKCCRSLPPSRRFATP